MKFIYLHGFASSPQSAKARYLRQRFAEVNLPLHLLDFNQGDFSHLTLTRQLQQTAAEFPTAANSVTLIGSSFGGLTAAWLGEQYPQVARMVCLAPAFGFLSHWLPKLGETTLRQWQESGYLPVYHYGERRNVDLDYGFIVDALTYDESQLQRPVPTLILHGKNDETIPIQASRDYAQLRSWVDCLELDSGHSLGDVLPRIWAEIGEFCDLEGC